MWHNFHLLAARGDFSTYFQGEMLINIHVYDVCCQTTLLNWTILGTEDDLLTLFLLFHEVCMLTQSAEGDTFTVDFLFVCRLWPPKSSLESC